jgi:protein involved in polysaccharide export with SLBB domain
MLIIGSGACTPNRLAVPPTPPGQMDQQAKAFPEREYIITPGDTLDIKFTFNPEFNELAMPVRPDGRISLQLAPDVQAAGLTPSQLRNVLKEKYAGELRTPEIAVIVRTFAENRVFVDGEVGAPGFVELRGRTTVMRALEQARGVRETARMSCIIVIRKDGEGKPSGTMVDLRKVIDGSDFSQDITLMPYDIVYVPKSDIARVDKFVAEYITGVIPGLNPYTYIYNTPIAPVQAR